MTIQTLNSTTPVVLGLGDEFILVDRVRLAITGDTAISTVDRVVNTAIDGQIYVENGAGIVFDHPSDFPSSLNRVTIGETGLITVAGSIGDTWGIGIADGNRDDVTNHGQISVIGFNAIGIYTAPEASRVKIFNTGTISSSNDGVDLRGSNGFFLNTGTVTAGDFGLRLSGASVDADNSGTIAATVSGVLTTANVRFSNSGHVAGEENAISVEGSGDAGDIFNQGSIIGGNYGIRVFTNTEAQTLVNSGTISGTIASYDTSAASESEDTIRNSGEMLGDVTLGTGNDRYLGSGDGWVDGTVFGGSGLDILRGGSRADSFEGGSGGDIMRGKGGDDTLLGDGGADVMRGNAGNDTLEGGNAKDTLNGGRDDDMLTGGAGADNFVFNRKAGDDEITDFGDGADTIDLTAFGLRNVDFDQVLDALGRAGGGASLLDLDALGGEGSVLIQGLTVAQAQLSDFVL